MAYLVHIMPQVREYLWQLEMPREDRVRLFGTISFDLRDDAESLVTDHLLKQPSNPEYVYWELTLPGTESATGRRFGFVVAVHAAPAGILTLVYVEEIP